MGEVYVTSPISGDKMQTQELGHGEFVWPYLIEQSPGDRFCVIPFDFTLIANATASLSYQLSTGWNFVLVVLNANATGRFRLQIFDDYTSENLFINTIGGVNGVRDDVITGVGTLSFVLPKTHRFYNGRSITVTVTDISGFANTIEVALIGYKESLILKEAEEIKGAAKTVKYAPSAQGLQKYIVDRLFVIPFNFTLTGAANTVYTSRYPISKGFNFMWEVLNSNINPALNITLQVKDEFVTEEFFTSAVVSGLITGSGQLPFILPRPYIFEGGTTITLTVTDIPGTVATPQIAFIGYKVRKVT
jgi:hypothetical protein